MEARVDYFAKLEVEMALIRPGVARQALCAVGAIVVLTLISCATPSPEPSAGPPPATRIETVIDNFHGVDVPDDYRWLEDQQSPETRTWIEEQNAYTLNHLGNRPERASLERRLTELLRIDRVATPIERSGRYFVLKKNADDDLWILFLRETVDGEDKVLLDPHPLSPDHTTSVDIEDISKDGTLLAYSIRRGGTDETEIRLMDVESREDYPDRFPNALYRGLAMKPDGSGFYYSLQDRKTGIRVRYHEMGSDSAEDAIVFGEGYGPSDWINAGLSESGRYLLFVVSHGWDRSELHLQDLKTKGPVVTIVDDLDASFFPGFGGDRLFVQTNWVAPNGRILEVDVANPGTACLERGRARRRARDRGVRSHRGAPLPAHPPQRDIPHREIRPRRHIAGGNRAARHRHRGNSIRLLGGEVGVLLFRVLHLADQGLSLRRTDRRDRALEPCRGALRSHRDHYRADLVSVQGRNPGADVPCVPRGSSP